MEKNTKLAHRRKNMSPAIIPDKAIILHTLEDAGICIIIISKWGDVHGNV